MHLRRVAGLSLVALTLASVGLTPLISAAPLAPGAHPGALGQATADHPAFQRVWQRTDGPVVSGAARRPWTWGPEPFYAGAERFNGGARQVIYYDKGRMEITNPSLPADSPGYVTNGQLVVELVAGQIQVGDTATQTAAPAVIPVAGDPFENPSAPTYASFRFVTSLPGNERRVPPRVGQSVTETIARDGFIGQNPHIGGAVLVGAYSEETGHNIPDVFVDFFNRRGLLDDGFQAYVGTVVDGPLTAGFPITEAYWTQIRIGGQTMDVLIQLFERRALVYYPQRTGDDRVEFGNVGRHYFDWRYHTGVPAGQPGRHKDLSVVLTGITRSSVELGPPVEAPPPTPAPTTPPGRRATPTPTPAPAPLPPGALTTTGLFVVAELSVTNVGLATTSLGLDDFIVVDSQGRRYEISREATALAAARLNRTGDRGPIRPGFTVQVVRAWEVPADARGLIMVPGYGEKPALALD